MPVASNPIGMLALVHRRRQPAVACTTKDALELLANHLLDKGAHALADAELDRVEPVIEQAAARIILRRLRAVRVRARASHGVVSGPARQRRTIRG